MKRIAVLTSGGDAPGMTTVKSGFIIILSNDYLC